MTPVVRRMDLVKVVKIDASKVKATTGAHLVIEIRGKMLYLVIAMINVQDGGGVMKKKTNYS